MVGLLRLMVIGALLWIGWRWVKRYRERVALALGGVPEGWRELGAQDRSFADALELRKRLGQLISEPSSLVDEALLVEVDGALSALARLARMRVRLGAHLHGLGPALGGSEDDDRLAAERERIEALRGRERRLTEELATSVSELRHAYLDVLEGVSGGSGQGSVTAEAVAERTRALRESVGARLEAEQEVESLLAEIGA